MSFIDCLVQHTASKKAWPEQPRCAHGAWKGWGDKWVSPTYSVWLGMKARCDRDYTNSYETYGGRGVTYSDRWQSFYKFREDMGAKPEGHDLDRIDPEGDYERDNCRWLLEGINRSRGGRTRARQMADQMIDRMESELKELENDLAKEGIEIE